MSSLFDRLQDALGDTYRLERELGGGGMSQVFLAEELELGRPVVIKVLPPDMSAGVNRERFEREIKLAARLQHPHVVPVLTAGSTGSKDPAGELLYYVMPYIEGESLRQRLGRDGELPVGLAVQMLREVVDALSYAHAHEVVHRDIKPDNVMVTAGHAVVTDFGVAKAVSASSGGTRSSLTSLGVALGTPAYMSPEQAAGDPHVDHRADIYAVGALAYELLTGRPPFTGATPQQVLAAHVSQAPEPVTMYRDTIPAGLADVVMRCLAKRASDRWQSAAELKAQLDGMTTPPSGGITPTGSQPVGAVSTGGANNPLRLFVDTPVKVAALYGVTAAFVLVFVYGLMVAMGLPDWVFFVAVALMVVGLPIVMATGRREHRLAQAHATGHSVTTPVGLERHFTWKKAIAGGGLAFAGLGVMAGAFMGARSMGIGPAATLASTGALAEREPVVLAEFDNRTADSTMGSTVTELLRVSLSQSPFVKLVDPARLDESLARMQRDPGTVINEDMALEIAERESIKAVLSGDVVPLGDGFVISARLVAADGTVLTAHRASASDAAGVMTAVDDVAAELREQMGESLRTIRRSAPLDLVTTGSIEALRLYTQAQQAEIAGDDDRAVDLLDRAIAIDSNFAMAYRKVGTILGNNFEQRSRSIAALTRAYQLRTRLTKIERGYAEAMYHSRVTGETENVIAAYRTILEEHPEDFRSLNNTGSAYGGIGELEMALGFFERALALDSTWSPGFRNVAGTMSSLGRFDDAERVLGVMEARFPGNPQIDDARANIATSQKDYETADSIYQAMLAQERGNLGWRAYLHASLASVQGLHGQLAAARRSSNEAQTAEARRGVAGNYLQTSLGMAGIELLVGDNPDRAHAIVAEALTTFPLDSIPPTDRPYEALIGYYVLSNQREAAEAVLADLHRTDEARQGRSLERRTRRAEGWVALARGETDRGLDLLREGSRDRGCLGCIWSDLAQAHDLAGNADSSLYYWSQFGQATWRLQFIDASLLPTAYRRLGELYEARNDRDNAVRYYNELLELWSNADPEMQPQVDEMRRRIAGLVGETR